MLSVIIIAKNEEANIRRCLESIKWVNEIIVLDSGSSDNTVAIAKEYTENVFQTDWPGYGIQKQRALEKATSTWVLNLDADEVVSEELKQELSKAIAQNDMDAYQVPIRLNFYGRTLKYSWSPKKHIRLFKRDGARYTDKIVHEEVLVPGNKIGQLSHAIQHYCIEDVSHALYKMNLYTTCSARITIQNNKSRGFFRTIIGSWWMFFRCYFIEGGILEGRDGFLLAVLSAQGSFYRGMKVIYQDKEKQ